MPINTVSALLVELARCPLLEPGRFDELKRLSLDPASDPRSLCRELLQRDWLTPFQVNQLLQGRAGELKIGSYVIVDRLGEVSVGELFKARHQHLRRLAAVQVVRHDLLAAPGAVQRFYEEVQAVGRLAHRHLLTAYDAGPVGATHFFAMEYVEGVDLQRLVDQAGPLPVADACRYIYQAALGLQHACERGLLHHDLRPANLLLVRPGLHAPGPELIKVSNLGLTVLRRNAGSSSRRGMTPPDHDASDPWDYTSPEQCCDPPSMTVCSELYSLGCVLYFLLTGHPPFPGGTAAEKGRRHQQEEPVPVHEFRLDIPVDVSAMVSRLMAKQPDARFRTPADAAAALMSIAGVSDASWDTASGVSGLTPSPMPVWHLRKMAQRPRWQLGVLAGGALLLVGLTFLGYLLFRAGPTAGNRVGTGVVQSTASPKPLPPTLIVQCGRGDVAQQKERAEPGYDCKLLDGSNWNGWTGAVKTHCWANGGKLRFEVIVPPATAGLLRLHCLDADTTDRKQKIFVQGKLIKQIEKFSGPGVFVEAEVTADETRQGKINVEIECLAGVNAVVSTVEFQPLARAK